MDGLYINSGGYFLLPFIYGEGGDLVDTDGEADRRQLRGERAPASQTAQDLVTSGAAVKPDANDSYGTMMTLFKESKVAMIINGPWEVANVAIRPRSSAASRTSASPRSRPARPRPGAPVGGHNYVIYSGMDDAKAEAAIAFVKFMSSAESRGVHRRRARPAARQRRRLRLGHRQREGRGLEAGARRRPCPSVDPRGRPVLRPARRDGHRGAGPGQATRKAALDEVAKKYKTEVVPDYSE